jgi:hypothetical protein
VFESHRGHGRLSVVSVLCVLSGRGLWDELITRPEESYRLWCVVVCDPEISGMRRPWPTGGCCAKNKQIFVAVIFENRFLLCADDKCCCLQSGR